MEEEFKYGQMVLGMMGSGKMTKQMGMADQFMLMEMFTKVLGQMMMLMEWVHINIMKVANILATGLEIKDMVLVLKNGQMEPDLTEIIKMV